MKTEWDYTDRAKTYDQRADYSEKAISDVLNEISLPPGCSVADIGAGTGKLTKVLLSFGFSVFAVEPNDNMRMYGKKNTVNNKVTWTEGIAEKTNLPTSSFDAVFFGSSFNVVDQKKALEETSRILKKNGWFVCMWNHRDITDPTQKNIEKIIYQNIPKYEYGKRREDPSETIKISKLFKNVFFKESLIKVDMKQKEIVEAWRSHDTLYRQSNGKFEKIIQDIDNFLIDDSYCVPYYTRIWFAQMI